MKNIIFIIINIVYFLSIFISALVWVAGTIYEIVGPGKFERIFSAIGISNGLSCIWIIGSIALILLIITYIIKTKYPF